MLSLVAYTVLHMMLTTSRCILEILNHSWELENVYKSTRFGASSKFL